MKNNDDNTKYRNCVDEIVGDCPYMIKNEYGTACCSVDGIFQVTYYGCTPDEVILKMAMKGD
jgi:hypothetical protein